MGWQEGPWYSRLVLLYDFSCREDDTARRAVIVLQVQSKGFWVQVPHTVDIFSLRRAPSVYALIWIANGSDTLTFRSKKTHQIELNQICILKLVYQDYFDIRYAGGMLLKEVNSCWSTFFFPDGFWAISAEVIPRDLDLEIRDWAFIGSIARLSRLMIRLIMLMLSELSAIPKSLGMSIKWP